MGLPDLLKGIKTEEDKGELSVSIYVIFFYGYICFSNYFVTIFISN